MLLILVHLMNTSRK